MEARALEEADAQSIAVFIHDDIICRHGVPEKLTSDRGTEFVNELIEILTRVYRIHHIKTTAYHPQGNGQTERTNRTFKDILAKIKPKKGDWSHYINQAAFITRSAKSASTGFSPAMLLTGQEFRQPYDSRYHMPTEGDQEIEIITKKEAARLQEIRKKAEGFIKKAQDRQKKEHDNRVLLIAPLKIGDPVLLYRNTIEANWSAKLETKWEGPLFIQSIKGTTYSLRRRNGSILPKTFHQNRLKLYHERAKNNYHPTVELGSQQSTSFQ